MYLRISSAVLAILALAACSKGNDPRKVVQVAADGSTEAVPEAVASPPGVPCALAGAKEFKQDCLIERSSKGGKQFVVVRHPDGGFRRLVVIDGGKRYASADGAESAEVVANGKEVEVTVEDDHYLFPAPGANAPQR
jgi:hypothetical protein